MRKQVLIEMVESRLSGGDTTADVKSRYHGAIIEKHIEAAYNKLIRDTYEEGVKNQDFSQLDMYARTFRNIDVSDDTDRNLKYSLLPFPPVRLPENLGIRMLYPQNDPTNPFAHVDSNSQAVFTVLDVGRVDDVPSFWIEKYEGNVYRIYYDQPDLSTLKIAVLMLLPLSQYDDFDEIPMPAGQDLAVVDLIVERMSAMAPEDQINDNIAKQ